MIGTVEVAAAFAPVAAPVLALAEDAPAATDGATVERLDEIADEVAEPVAASVTIVVEDAGEVSFGSGASARRA